MTGMKFVEEELFYNLSITVFCCYNKSMPLGRDGEKNLYITKADGTSEPFRREKLIESLLRSGANPDRADEVVHQVLRNVRQGSGTQEIYNEAFRVLRKKDSFVAARYSLRRALHDLGPTGFPFEDFVAELFRREGYIVSVRQMFSGRCIPHEVDVIARKGDEHMLCELKFHNDPGYKTDIKTALYVGGRMHDLQMGSDPVCKIATYALITNTKFTNQATDYGACAGLRMIGFQEPHENSLYDRMIRTNTYPVTALTTFSHREKRLLIARGILLCDHIGADRALAYSSGVSRSKIDAGIEESRHLCAVA